MKKLNDQELISIQGGATKWAIGILISGIVTFIIGVLDGIRRPLRCN